MLRTRSSHIRGRCVAAWEAPKMHRMANAFKYGYVGTSSSEPTVHRIVDSDVTSTI